MRIHITMMLFVAYFAYQLSLSRIEIMVLLITIGIVIAAEMINTAIEKLCDFVQKKHSVQIRVIKDASAGAVLVLALAAIGVGALLFFNADLLEWLKSLESRPGTVFGLAAALTAAGFFIFWKPIKISKKIKK
jgi:Diacylglycerol kinase